MVRRLSSPTPLTSALHKGPHTETDIADTHSPAIVEVIRDLKDGSVLELDSMALTARLCTTFRAGSRTRGDIGVMGDVGGGREGSDLVILYALSASLAVCSGSSHAPSC